TLTFYMAYATTMTDTYPAKTPLSHFQDILTKAAAFATDYVLPVSLGCCDLAGDFNNDGAVDITDLTAMVDFMFAGGAPAPCADEADVDSSETIDITDLTYRVDFMFAGGPAPICGDSGM
ncbi:MAG: hypothetical protein P1R58_13195, partial [bacterium]|nr:hypothetical protein [bacterium]